MPEANRAVAITRLTLKFLIAPHSCLPSAHALSPVSEHNHAIPRI
jgi:hypothetical protein